MGVQGFLLVNRFARATPWLHAPARLFALYGVVLFAGLLPAGWLLARRRREGMAAAVWAPVRTLLAVGVNQPIAAAVAEPRPYLRCIRSWCWSRCPRTRRSPPITPRRPGRWRPGGGWCTGGSARSRRSRRC